MHEREDEMNKQEIQNKLSQARTYKASIETNIRNLEEQLKKSSEPKTGEMYRNNAFPDMIFMATIDRKWVIIASNYVGDLGHYRTWEYYSSKNCTKIEGN